MTGTGTGTDSGNSSPVARPVAAKIVDCAIPQLPPFSESPRSSAPSTPPDEAPRLGHRRTDSVTIEGEDYFLSLAKFASGDSKSIPGTPRSIAARNISFSPRIQFHDTWPSGEYDRRGEIATCNRLTPMLAQQIKEELNTFKMVCSSCRAVGRSTANSFAGNGSARDVQGVHPFFLMIASSEARSVASSTFYVYEAFARVESFDRCDRAWMMFSFSKYLWSASNMYIEKGRLSSHLMIKMHAK